MKNIHILPTDKPSRLIIYSTMLNELRLLNEPITDWKHKRHIYITSDEEIKEDDISIPYCITWANGEHEVFCSNNRISDARKLIAKKIILTTDEKLIKNGVQSIDDEFLEWFVKNPSCEEVPIITVVYLNKSTYRTNIGFEKWRIGTIPKEETKQ
jgi:hypothetical protein